jgi:hypothetical protein
MGRKARETATLIPRGTMKMLIQSRLRNGTTEMVCWLEEDSRVHKGSRITIKGDEAVWQVVDQYLGTKSEYHEINRNWKVGGL